MSLFTDDGWLTVADLGDEAPKLITDAGAEEIKLERCISKAIDSVGTRITNDLLSFQSYPSYGANFAVYSALGMTSILTRVTLQQIVVDTPDGSNQSPIKTWALHEAIRIAYRQCMNTNEVDRYQSRANEEEEEILNRLYPRFFNRGAGITRYPIYRPGAAREFFKVGRWADASVSAVAGSGAGGTFDVAVTYVDQTSYKSWQLNGNAESAPSDIVTVDTSAGQDIRVDISCFAPPQGLTPVENIGVIFPRKATGWNIYCGPTGETLRLQNPTPFALPAVPTGLTQPLFGSLTPQTFTPVAGYADMGIGQRREVTVQPMSRTKRF